MGISNTENNNNNGFYSYLQKNYLTYITTSIRHQKVRSIKKLETIINIKSNFRSY